MLGVLGGLSAWAQPTGPSVWGESSMERVRPGTPPGSRQGVALIAARNEFISFQVGLHGGAGGWRNVSASLPSIEGPMRIEGRELVLYRETFLNITLPTTRDTPAGPWPDGLVPDVDETYGEKRQAFPLNVPAGESRALWVDVHVPAQAPPGEYHGTVQVTGDGYSGQVEVQLTVVDAALPSTSSLRTRFALYMPNVCDAFTGQKDCAPEDQLRMARAFYRLGLEHRVSMAAVFVNPALQDNSLFDTFWAPFLSGTEPTRLPGAQLTAVPAPNPSAADKVSEFGNRVESSGWLARAYTFIGDEPSWQSTPEEVRANGIVARQAAPQVRTLVTSNLNYLEQNGLADYVDILAVLVNFVDGTQPNFQGYDRSRYAEFLARPNHELWLYQSCASHGCDPYYGAPENKPGQGWPSYMLDRPAAKVRAMEWVSFLEGAKGELYYETVHMLTTAWTNQFDYGGNGDGTLFYPGTTTVIGGTTDVPLPSIRLKLIRLGMQDYEWLKAVSDAGDPGYARWVARSLIPTAWRVPDDGGAFERARVMLILRYLELKGVQWLPSVHGGPARSPQRVPASAQ